MLGGPTRSTRRVLAGAVALACIGAGFSAGALAQLAGTAQPVTPATPDLTAALEALRAELDAGRVVKARALAQDLLTLAGTRPDADPVRLAAIDIFQSADAALARTDRVEVTLQRAEFDLERADIRAAERSARSVLRQPGLDEAQRARANSVLAKCAARKTELRPAVESMAAGLDRDFSAGRYAAARDAIESIYRSGVELDEERWQAIETMQLRLFDLERTGAAGTPELASAAVMQPGTVRRTDRPAGAQTAPAPAAEPAPAPVEEPLVPAEPAPVQVQMAAQDAPQSWTPPPAAGEDLIQLALKAEAQRILAEADLAFREGRYNEAASTLDLLLARSRSYLTPDEITTAERQLAEARIRLRSPVGGQSLQESVLQSEQIRREQALAEFGNEVQQANRALDAGDISGARDLAARARLTINRARPVFAEQEFDDYSRQVEDLARRIDSRAESISASERATAEATQARQAREAQDALRADRERKIRESIERVRALQVEQQYEEALQVVDQILFLDPNNPTGLLLRDVISRVVVYRRYNELQRSKQIGFENQTLENEEAMIAPRGVVNYPEDWPSKSFLRGEGAAYAESPENRRVYAQLDNRRIPAAEFADNTLSDVVEFLGTVADVRFDVDWDSLADIGVRRSTRVSLSLTDTPVRVVLERVLEKVSREPDGRAGWSVIDGIVTVASDDALRRQTSLVMYSISDLLFEIPDYGDVPVIDLAKILDRAGNARPAPRLEPFADELGKTAMDYASDREARVRKIIELIENHVDFNGWRDNGGDTGSIEELNGSLIVTTTPRNHQQISGLLNKLRDIRSMQINVETRFLLVAQDWFEQIGFDIDVYFNANNNQVRFAQGTEPAIQAGDFFDFTAGGLQRQVDAPGGVPAQQVVNPRSWSVVGAPQNSLGLSSFLAQNNSFAADILSQAPALGVAGQFLDDVQVDFLIQATQADRRTVTLTAPRLTFTNGQLANIFVGTQRGFISDLTPQVGESAAAFDPEVAALTDGVTLALEGVISADRRYVTLNVTAGVNRLERFDLVPVTAIAGGQLVNSADTQSFVQLPLQTVTQVQTTVTVPDEGTVLMGGQRLLTEIEVETGVPVLSKLPIINRFFTNRIEAKTEQTLLILIKPTILIQTELEEQRFPGLNDSLRTGLGG